MTEPRPITSEEGTDLLLNHFHDLIHYWSKLPADKLSGSGSETHQRMSGLVFSILSTFDGCTDLPAFLISPCPHEDDKAYLQEEGENWWEYENAIGETSDGKHFELHTRFVALERERKGKSQ